NRSASANSQCQSALRCALAESLMLRRCCLIWELPDLPLSSVLWMLVGPSWSALLRFQSLPGSNRLNCDFLPDANEVQYAGLAASTSGTAISITATKSGILSNRVRHSIRREHFPEQQLEVPWTPPRFMLNGERHSDLNFIFRFLYAWLAVTARIMDLLER